MTGFNEESTTEFDTPQQYSKIAMLQEVTIYLSEALRDFIHETGLDCSEAAEIVKGIIQGYGYKADVVTLSTKKDKGSRDLISNLDTIFIPASNKFLTGPYGYHTVAVLDDDVYTAEIPGFHMNFNEYKAYLRKLNPGKMIYEKKEIL